MRSLCPPTAVGTGKSETDMKWIHMFLAETSQIWYIYPLVAEFTRHWGTPLSIMNQPNGRAPTIAGGGGNTGKRGKIMRHQVLTHSVWFQTPTFGPQRQLLSPTNNPQKRTLNTGLIWFQVSLDTHVLLNIRPNASKLSQTPRAKKG